MWRAGAQASRCDSLFDALFQAEMERALLQGERQAEHDQIEAETDIVTQLQRKLDELESAIQREKDKVEGPVGWIQLTFEMIWIHWFYRRSQVYRIQTF